MVYSPKKYRETEGTKVRRLGFALDEATLKQVAFNHGITQSYESMTQAQKAQLRYVAMIEQAKNIGVTGDMSRTIDTAANGVRILEARIQQFCRAVGDMLMPLLSAVLPYVTAFVQLVTEGANALAELFGFELPKIELGNISGGYDEVAAAAGDATAATEKFKGSLAGVDQLNIIGSHTDKNGTGTGYSTDLNIELPTYDFLNGVESKTKEIAENMKKWFQDALPWIEAVGTAIAGFAISQGLINGIKALGSLKTIMSGLSSKIAPVSVALAAAAGSGMLLFNATKKLTKGSGGLPELIGGLTVAVGAFAAFIAFGNPLGAVIVAVGALVGAVAGCTTAVQELNQETYNSILYSDQGTSIKEIADAYSDWTDSITKVDDKIKENQTTIENNQKTIEDELGALEDLTRSFEASGDMSEEMANKISEASQKITTAISSNLTTDLNNMILGVGEAWDTVAQKAGMAKEEIMGALYANKNKGNEALSALQKQLDEYVSEIASSEKGSVEYFAAIRGYNQTMEQFTAVSNAAIGQEESTLDLKSKLTSLSSGEISLMDADTALSALEQIMGSYTNASQKMLDSKNSAIASAQREYDVLKALGVDVDESLYKAMEKGAEENYKMRMSELYEQTRSVVDSLYTQIKMKTSDASVAANAQLYGNTMEAAKGLMEGDMGKFGAYVGGMGTYIDAWWRGFWGGTDANTVLSEDYLKNSGGDKILDELEGIMSKIEANQALTFGGSNGETSVDYHTVSKEFQASAPTGYATGYAREAMGEAYSNAAARQAIDSTPAENNVYVTVEIDGEEIANTTQRVASQQVAMSNGR